jgi:hypothetical protein
MNNLNEYLPLLVDYTTLVYHEARNVRHLIQEQHIEPEDWKYLIALPVNKYKAWEVLQDTRRAAKQAGSVKVALLQFERRFRVTLEQLQVLYVNPAWHHAAYGGNKWKDITKLVQRLAVALENEQEEEISMVSVMLSQAKHNTGSLVEKLRKLDDALR